MNGFNLSDITDAKFGNVQVSELYFGSTKIWPLYHDYSRDYLTFQPLENSVRFVWTDTNHDNSIYYSLDNGSTWTLLTSGSSTPAINTNEKIIFKAAGRQTLEGIGTFSANGYFNAMGNIMSLAHGDNFINNNTLNNYQFKRLFYDCYNLVNASNLILPATTLTNYCYSWMFDGCYSLVTTPELLATTLANHCYENMFGGCRSLTTAPALPATTLAPGCYFSMFISCASLTTAPALPATTLASHCYCEMFDSCTSLTTAPELPATTLANHCYDDMFGECTSLTTAPELPATTLTDYCYEHMFNRCTLLNYVKCLATDITATDCTTSWLDGVSATGTFVKDVNTTWTTGISSIPVGWTVQNEGIPNEYFYVETTHNTGGYDDYLELEILCSTYSSVNYRSTHQTLYYSYDKTNWYRVPYRDITETCNIYNKTISGTKYEYAADLMKIPFNNNNIIYLKGNLSPHVTSTAQAGTVQFDAGIIYKLRSCYKASQETPNNFNVGGNICSLLYGDINHNTIPNDYTYVFESMFNWPITSSQEPVCNVTNASQLIMPVNATDYCFARMFRLCRSLTTAPALPATTLASYCYQHMFNSCSSLTTAPELPATILADWCYSFMFNGCSSLNYIKCLATDMTATSCTTYWLNNVPSTGTFVKKSSASWVRSASGIPTGWTIQNAS